MKQPGTLVEHEGREYLLVEGGFNPETRSVILLARPGDPRVARNTEQRPVTWANQGQWTPLARWTADELRLPDERNEPQRDFARALIEAYVAGHKAPPPKAWTAIRGQAFAGELHASLPMGLATVCYESREAAAATPEIDDVVPVENLGLFLTHLVRQGYAGTLWNGSQPVIFCVDDTGDLQFLRLSPGQATVAMEILDEHDRWRSYDGAESIEVIDNREACDKRLVEVLGSKPPIEWPEDGRLWSLGPGAGEPQIFTATEGQNEVRHAALFTDEEAAREFQEDQAPEAQVFQVQDLNAFLTSGPMEGNVATLNPGGHRANSGLLWSDGERVVLDNFSGFWKLAGGRFELLASSDPDGAEAAEA